MSNISTPSGAFSSVFVGSFSASTPLIRVSNQRTGGSTPEINTPTEYNIGTNSFEISGLSTVKCSLQFYTDTGIPFLLDRSLPVETGSINDPPPAPASKYVVLLINADSTKQSYLLQEVSTLTNLDPNYDKDKPTQITVTFVGTNISPSYLVKFGTPTYLKSLLGGRSPI